MLKDARAVGRVTCDADALSAQRLAHLSHPGNAGEHPPASTVHVSPG